jgi:hypothetical protein
MNVDIEILIYIGLPLVDEYSCAFHSFLHETALPRNRVAAICRDTTSKVARCQTGDLAIGSYLYVVHG